MKLDAMISCDRYDDIEVLCVYHYPIRLDIEGELSVEGVALDTTRNTDGEECLLLQTSSGEQQIVLDHLIQIEVLVENPHLRKIQFQPSA